MPSRIKPSMGLVLLSVDPMGSSNESSIAVATAIEFSNKKSIAVPTAEKMVLCRLLLTSPYVLGSMIRLSKD